MLFRSYKFEDRKPYPLKSHPKSYVPRIDLFKHVNYVKDNMYLPMENANFACSNCSEFKEA